MVHTVDMDFPGAGDPGQEGFRYHGDSVGGDFIGKGLGMGDGEILLKLAGNILVDITPQADINQLNATANAKERFLCFYDLL